MSRPRPVTWNGIAYETTTDAARAHDVNYSTMAHRIENGKTCDDDVHLPGIPAKREYADGSFWACVAYDNRRKQHYAYTHPYRPPFMPANAAHYEPFVDKLSALLFAAHYAIELYLYEKDDPDAGD